MKVIITGGTGLIGKALGRSLAAGGQEVIVLSRRPEKAAGLPAGVRAVGWDARTADGWGHLIDGNTAIVHLAGESIGGEGFIPTRWTAAQKQRTRDSRLNTGRAVTEAIRAAATKPLALIQASAVGYYGPRGSEIVTEEATAGTDFLSQVCVEWEASTAEVESLGVRRVRLRTGLVLTTQGGALPRIVLPFKLFVGGPFGSGRQYYSWIHIDDEIGAIRFLLDNATTSGPYNLTAPNPVTNAEFSQTLGRVLRRPAIIPAPAPLMRLALGEVATVVLDGQRAAPQRLQQAGYRFHFADLEPALRDLLR